MVYIDRAPPENARCRSVMYLGQPGQKLLMLSYTIAGQHRFLCRCIVSVELVAFCSVMSAVRIILTRSMQSFEISCWWDLIVPLVMLFILWLTVGVWRCPRMLCRWARGEYCKTFMCWRGLILL